MVRRRDSDRLVLQQASDPLFDSDQLPAEKVEPEVLEEPERGQHEPAFELGRSVAYFQSEILEENLVRASRGLSPADEFDGHANCFIETGHGKAMLIDFNYDTEPLPGRFPLAGVGPFTLLEESRANHWGKMGFKWVYWNLLVAGKELPLYHNMMMSGKWS